MLKDAATGLVALAGEHPLVALLLVASLALIGGAGWLLRTAVMREACRKTWYLCRNTATADIGWRDVLYWLVMGGLVGLPVALGKGYGRGGDNTFHWAEFWLVMAIVAVSNAARAVFDGLSKHNLILRPVHGSIWRLDRKAKCAAILKRVNRLLGKGQAPPTSEVRQLLTDTLDVIASHVRDHRGRHKKVDVFANLLLLQGMELVVVARDPILHHKDHHRPVPSRHAATALAVSRAIESRSIVAVGDYQVAYPESPKNKPYRAILGIPLISSDDRSVIGVVSVDAALPYFFESFTPGVLENDLENSLAPYLHILTLVLEALLTREPQKMVELLLAPDVLETGDGK